MTGVKKNFLKLTLDKSHFITETRNTSSNTDFIPLRTFVPVIIKNLCCKDWSRKLIYDTYGGMKRSIFCKKV